MKKILFLFVLTLVISIFPSLNTEVEAATKKDYTHLVFKDDTKNNYYKLEKYEFLFAYEEKRLKKVDYKYLVFSDGKFYEKYDFVFAYEKNKTFLATLDYLMNNNKNSVPPGEVFEGTVIDGKVVNANDPGEPTEEVFRVISIE